jgi:glycosyltransferase involved in cell wall biosynthesis
MGSIDIVPFPLNQKKMANRRSARVLIVGSPYAHHNREVFLQKFTRLLSEVSESVCVVGANEPADRDNVSWIQIEIPDEIVGIGRYTAYVKKQIEAILLARDHDFEYDTVFVRITHFFLPGLWARLRGKQSATIVTQRTVHPLINRLQKLNFILSKNILVESPSILAEWDGEAYAEKAIVGATYVDAEKYYKTKPYSERDSVVGYLGTLDRRKGVDKLLTAFERLAEDGVDVTFKIGGSGPLADDAESLAEHYEAVEYCGFVPDKDLCEFYNDLQLFVLPSTSEGLPNVALEAMACGTPVLATPVGGLPDIIETGKTGYLLESDEPSSIISGIKQILGHNDLNEVSNRAAAVIEDEYRYEAAVTRYERILYNELR